MKLRNLLVMLLLLTGAILFVACEGERGPAGPAGPAGKDGVDGKDGAPGPAGADGRVGKDAPRDARCDVSNGIDVSGGLFLIYGTADDDVICAKNGNSEIRALAGDDTVYGGGGADKMIGGDGDDTMYSEGGNDHFFILGEKGANKWIGGKGKDIIYFRKDNKANFILETGVEGGLYTIIPAEKLSTGVTFDLSSGSYDGTSLDDTGTFTFEGIEDVFASNGASILTGDAEDNFLAAGDGADTITGGDGDDVLTGGNGHDTMTGGDGDDVLYRWWGNDVMTGGAGADTFVIEGGWRNHALPVIKDFNVVEDKIYFNEFSAGDSARVITTDVGKIKVGTLAAVEIHDSNGASATQATAIKDKATDVIKFTTAKLDPKTRRYIFTDD